MTYPCIEITALLDRLAALNMNQQVHELTKQARDTGGYFFVPDAAEAFLPVEISLHGITVEGASQLLAVENWKAAARDFLFEREWPEKPQAGATA